MRQWPLGEIHLVKLYVDGDDPGHQQNLKPRLPERKHRAHRH